MKHGNIFSGIGMILLATALLLDSNQMIGETMYSVLLGISIGLGILTILLPRIRKEK